MTVIKGSGIPWIFWQKCGYGSNWPLTLFRAEMSGNNETSFTLPVGLDVCPGAKSGKLQGGRFTGDVVWVCFLNCCCSSPADPWLVGTKGCIPFSPLPASSWEGCGKYCLPQAGGSRQQGRNFSFKILLFVSNFTGCCLQLRAALQVRLL